MTPPKNVFYFNNHVLKCSIEEDPSGYLWEWRDASDKLWLSGIANSCTRTEAEFWAYHYFLELHERANPYQGGGIT